MIEQQTEQVVQLVSHLHLAMTQQNEMESKLKGLFSKSDESEEENLNDDWQDKLNNTNQDQRDYMIVGQSEINESIAYFEYMKSCQNYLNTEADLLFSQFHEVQIQKGKNKLNCDSCGFFHKEISAAKNFENIFTTSLYCDRCSSQRYYPQFDELRQLVYQNELVTVNGQLITNQVKLKLLSLMWKIENLCRLVLTGQLMQGINQIYLRPPAMPYVLFVSEEFQKLSQLEKPLQWMEWTKMAPKIWNEELCDGLKEKWFKLSQNNWNSYEQKYKEEKQQFPFLSKRRIKFFRTSFEYNLSLAKKILNQTLIGLKNICLFTQIETNHEYFQNDLEYRQFKNAKIRNRQFQKSALSQNELLKKRCDQNIKRKKNKEKQEKQRLASQERRMKVREEQLEQRCKKIQLNLQIENNCMETRNIVYKLNTFIILFQFLEMEIYNLTNQDYFKNLFLFNCMSLDCFLMVRTQPLFNTNLLLNETENQILLERKIREVNQI